MRGSVVALVGAQYGSEGKGAMAQHLADRFEVHVRTGAPNAGHTFYHENREWVARSVPVGWINSEALLVIGPGALIDLNLLIEEVMAIEEAGYGVATRLYVDKKAMVIDPTRHHQYEGGTTGRAHRMIGSTGEGVGPARMAKIARGTYPSDLGWAKINGVDEYRNALNSFCNVCDTEPLLNSWIDDGNSVLLEGTQGSALSLTHGEWPYVTSTDTNAASLAADAGISPRLIDDVILVARTFPIRVAGNSGPLKRETSFQELGVAPEFTTVTKKQRRIGQWDDELLAKAIRLNRPCRLAITFLDYAFPDAEGAAYWDDLPIAAARWIADLQNATGCPVSWVATGMKKNGDGIQVVDTNHVTALLASWPTTREA